MLFLQRSGRTEWITSPLRCPSLFPCIICMKMNEFVLANNLRLCPPEGLVVKQCQSFLPNKPVFTFHVLIHSPVLLHLFIPMSSDFLSHLSLSLCLSVFIPLSSHLAGSPPTSLPHLTFHSRSALPI